MALHRVQWRSYQDLRPPERRFEYMDRMAEDDADEHAAARQRAEAHQQGQAPIEPDQVVEMHGSKVKVFVNDKAREMARRDMEAKAMMGGRR